MKPTLALLVLFFASPLAAFDTTPRKVATIGVLTASSGEGWAADASLARSVVGRLSGELRERGFDASPTETTLEEERDREARFDVLVEISSTTYDNDAIGGVGIGGRDGVADISVVRSHATAIVRIFDGVTLEEIDSSAVEQRSTGIAPTGVGIGGRHVGIWIALPIARYTQQRALAQGLAEQAATEITAALRGEPQPEPPQQ